MEDGATKHQAAHAADYELVATGIKDEQDVARQIAIVEQMVARRVNAIVLAPADSKALVGVVKKAVDAGVAVVNIDNRLDRDAMAERGLDGAVRRAGQPQGCRCRWRVSSRSGSRRAIRSRSSKARRTPSTACSGALGFEDASREAGLVIARSQTAYWETARANQVVTALVTERPDLKAILCANDIDGARGRGGAEVVGPCGTGAGRRVRQHLRGPGAHHERRHDRHRRSARRSARRLRHRVRARASPRTGDGAGRSRDTGRSRHRGEASAEQAASLGSRRAGPARRPAGPERRLRPRHVALPHLDDGPGAGEPGARHPAGRDGHDAGDRHRRHRSVRRLRAGPLRRGVRPPADEHRDADSGWRHSAR